MNSLKLLPIIILLCCSAAVQATTNPEDTRLSFPFFQSGQSSGISDQLMVGYGDYTTTIASEEGLHMGIDLYPESAVDQVLNPFNTTMFSIGAYYADTVSEYTGCIIGIGPEGSDYGWAIEHLGPKPDKYADAYDWCSVHTRGTVLSSGMPIDTCCIYSSSIPRHTHIQWSRWELDQFHPGGYIMPNPWDALVNPFSFFTDSTELSGYDQVSFKAAWPEIWFLYPDSTNTGIFFLPDGIAETCSAYVSTVGEENKFRFQDIIYGAVDIVVEPFSELLDYPDNSGCGVYNVGYEILRQNPLDPDDWQTTESSQGSWGTRYLFTAEGQIEEPSVWVDIYEALFYDRCLFENAYIVTNSGADDPSSWQHGWDNVWTTVADDDWTDGICRGAWNTFLANPDVAGDPSQNSEAFFPDGRYAVDVTAVSHSRTDTVTMRLPVDDLFSASPTVEGVVVDNHIPFITRVAVYEWDPVADTCCKLYAGYWEDFEQTWEVSA